MSWSWFSYLAIALLWIPLFFYTGMFYERMKWNQLIEEGILPKPTKRKRIFGNKMEYKVELYSTVNDYEDIIYLLTKLNIKYRVENQYVVGSGKGLRTKDTFYFNNEKDALWFKLKYV